MIKKSSRLLFIFAAVLIIVMAFAVSITRLFLPFFEEYRVDIEKLATKELNRPVKIGEVIADWGGINPRMRIKNVKVYTPDGSQVWIKFDEVQVYFNVFSSLIHWRLLPGKINIVGAVVDIEYRNDSYYIGGLKIDTHSNLKESKLLNWVIEREKLVLWEKKQVRGLLLIGVLLMPSLAFAEQGLVADYKFETVIDNQTADSSGTGNDARRSEEHTSELQSH